MNRNESYGRMRGAGLNYLGALFTMMAAFLCGCRQELSTMSELPVQSFNLKLGFKPVVDGVQLDYNKPYQNQLGETYSVEAFKFYISGIRLINSVTNTSFMAGKNEHFLIDASTAGTSTISVKAVPGQFDQLAFIVGVDSSRNYSGAQTGALDPAKGMFWTWNSGYIMAKLEGSSLISNQPNHKFEYHIGGFRGAENVAREIILPFPPDQSNHFLQESTHTINLAANVNAWFNGSNNISIATNPVCMTPGTLATKIADNYSAMFTITDIVNN